MVDAIQRSLPADGSAALDTAVLDGAGPSPRRSSGGHRPAGWPGRREAAATDTLSPVRALRAALGRLTDEPLPDAPAARELARRCRDLANGMHFGFLYDRTRHLFAIGYRLADADGPGRLDSSYYDLLASEARLASFLAIANGDVPQPHWFRLGRLAVSVDGVPTLLSWSATMFEYLMPLLLMRSFPGTLLDQTCRARGAAPDPVRRGSTACRGGCPNRPTTSSIATAPTSTRRSACPDSG